MLPGHELLRLTPDEAKAVLETLDSLSWPLVAYLIARLKYAADNRRSKTEDMVARRREARLDLEAIEDQARLNLKLKAEMEAVKAMVAQVRGESRTPIILAPVPPLAANRPEQDQQQQGQQQSQGFYQYRHIEQQAA